MDTIRDLITLLFFPGGLFLLAAGLAYQWADRKLMARMQNRVGPRWFQPLADMVKLMAKEEVVPDGAQPFLFLALPVIALAGALTAALYVPLVGLAPAHSFAGDLIVVVYLLSLLTICTGLAGSNVASHFSRIGATRTLTQLFSYEAPFLLALLGPAIVAGSWQIAEVASFAETRPLLALTQPLGLIVGVLGLMGKLELAPFDAPEAETEIVAGALTEYSGRGLALFLVARNVELVIGLSLIAAFYLGGVSDPLNWLVKTGLLLAVIAVAQSVLVRLRIDQTVGLWWRYGALLALAQFLILIVLKGIGVTL
jgi:NADH-quinone oxidoreductase subunit H